MKISSTNLHSQTVRARELKFWEGSPPPTCHVSCVTCHLSHVTCHMSFVIQQKIIILRRDEASRWKVCYQRDLIRLVSICSIHLYPKYNSFICNPLRQRGSSFPAGPVFISKEWLTEHRTSLKYENINDVIENIFCDIFILANIYLHISWSNIYGNNYIQIFNCPPKKYLLHTPFFGWFTLK